MFRTYAAMIDAHGDNEVITKRFFFFSCDNSAAAPPSAELLKHTCSVDVAAHRETANV